MNVFSLTDLPFRWIQEWDIELQLQNRRIALTLDNFSGHKIEYQPKHITFIYFEPGLTSHIQPLDAGIIRCFKAHYRRLFCLRAIQQDEAEEQDIYKTNLLEAMIMAERAWKDVSSNTIKNCWKHTEIQRPRLPLITLRRPRPPMPANLTAGWDLIVDFATNSWSIPEAHSALQERLGDQYIPSEWDGPLDAALGAEGDVSVALAAISDWRNKWAPDSPPEAPDSPSKAPDSPSDLYEVATIPDEHNDVEEQLLELVRELKDRRRIIGDPSTLDEMLDPIEERVIGDCLDSFEGGNLDSEIVQMVQAKARGDDIEEISSDSDDDEPEVVLPSLKEMIEVCRKLEGDCLLVCKEDALDYVEAVRKLRGHLQKMSGKNAKQTTLEMFFNS